MKIQYVSDLHLEYDTSNFSIEKAGDILVLAGDCFNGKTTAKFTLFLAKVMDLGFDAVFYVMGNHEGYGWSYAEAIEFLAELDTKIPDFWVLNKTGVNIDGVRFLGCPLWSHPDANAKIQARLYIRDYQAVSDWDIEKHIEAHHIDHAWLSTSVKTGDVVITHFPPTRNGTDVVRFGSHLHNPMSSWFVNNMIEEIRKWQPAIWISGHTHHVWDEMVYRTRDVGNCRGYPNLSHSTGQVTYECKNFNPIKTITYGKNWTELARPEKVSNEEVIDDGPKRAA